MDFFFSIVQNANTCRTVARTKEVDSESRNEKPVRVDD